MFPIEIISHLARILSLSIRLFGNIMAKETLLATAVHHSLPAAAAWILTLSSVLVGALMLAISGRLIWDTFLGHPRDGDVRGHEAPALMLLAPALPTGLSLLLLFFFEKHDLWVQHADLWVQLFQRILLSRFTVIAEVETKPLKFLH